MQGIHPARFFCAIFIALLCTNAAFSISNAQESDPNDINQQCYAGDGYDYTCTYTNGTSVVRNGKTVICMLGKRCETDIVIGSCQKKLECRYTRAFFCIVIPVKTGI